VFGVILKGLNMQLFYLQDSRGYVGNDVLWWAKDGKGYTTDLSKAHAYTKDEAVAQHEMRETDIPWPKDYIDAKTRPAVDMQYIKREEALAGTGIVLTPEPKPKPKREQYRCESCKVFMSEAQMWSGCCPRCGADSRP
jgi:hypothetical protein